jgi:hypothetical protein
LQVVLDEAVEEYYARAVSLKTIEAILVSKRKEEERREEKRREDYLHDDPTTFEYTSFVEQKAKNACRLLCRYHRVVSQFAHTNIRADTKLGVELSARALYGNAAIEQYQCTKIEQMNEIEGTTEFGADAARVVLLGQVE